MSEPRESLLFNARQRAISDILQEAFGPDPSVPAEAVDHYEVDAHFLDMMLNASPSEEHILDYLGVQGPGADVDALRVLAVRLLRLSDPA